MLTLTLQYKIIRPGKTLFIKIKLFGHLVFKYYIRRLKDQEIHFT